jgi:hypothetical protein
MSIDILQEKIRKMKNPSMVGLDPILELIPEYVKQEAYEKYGETEDDRNRVIGAVMEQSAATLEILQFAYANSAKLPQGIKDVINLKYANTLKTLASDEDLIEIVKSVRTKINEGITPGEERDE